MALAITVYIDGVDKTGAITFGSLNVENTVNDAIDTCTFSITYSESQTYTPVISKEVIVYDGATKIFGGVITDIKFVPVGFTRVYNVTCKDYSQYLDRYLIQERYENMTVGAMIADILSKYAVGFTGTNVAAGTPTLKVITFNRVSISDALSQLAKRINYFWYIDYNKDVHFFPKTTEAAPFNITDSSANYVYESLNISSDFTQIRNRIIVTGGETESNSRTLLMNGTGTNTGFPLAYKFSKLPTVTVGGVGKTVGVDGIDSASSFDALWSFSGKSLTFASAPASGTENISVTGIPLLPLVVIVSDAISIANYGVYEYNLQQTNINSRTDALALGHSELDAYKDPIKTATFSTNTYGLRAGQVITINSAKWGVNESFIIQRVGFKMNTESVGEWTVSVSTLKTLTLTAILESLLTIDEGSSDSLESLFALEELADPMTMSTSYVTRTATSAPYFYAAATDYVDYDNYPSSNQDSTILLYPANNVYGYGEAFTAATTQSLGKVSFYLQRAGTVTGNITAKLFAATGTVGSTAVPSGAALATTTVAASTVGTSLGLIDFVFSSPPTMTAASKYCITLEHTGVDASNHIKVGADGSSPSYAGNALTLATAGGSFTAVSTVDTIFYLYQYVVNAGRYNFSTWSA